MKGDNNGEKKIVTVSLSKRNVEWVDGQCNNRSAYVNDLIDAAREGGRADVDTVVKRHELMRLKSQREEMKGSIESINNQIERYEAELEQQSAKRGEVVREAKQLFEGMDVGVENPAVKNKAEEAEMTPAELLEEINDE